MAVSVSPFTRSRSKPLDQKEDRVMNDDLHVPVEQEDLPDADEQEDFPDADEQEDFSERDEQEDFPDADEQEEPLVPVRHRPPRKSGGQRHKVLRVTLEVLAALAGVSGRLDQALGPGAFNTSTPI